MNGETRLGIRQAAAALGVYLFITLVVFALGAFAVAGVAWVLTRYTNVGIEVILPILLVYGVVTLLVALAALVGILSSFGLTDRSGKFALGLPEGSIQAVIALILVLIFAITAVFLSTIEIGPNGISEQFATQILTTAGTLAVAVAGFYFGTRAVETGAETTARAAEVAAAPKRSVRVVSPPSPVTMEGRAQRIAIATVPAEGAAVTWSISGDDTGELVQLRPGEFEYRRGKEPQPEVTLRFELVGEPTAFGELKVLFPS
jgi:hypothetical protein